MTPADRRRGLRLADALAVIADEMVRPDACPAIITAHAGCAIELCDVLAGTPREVPVDAGPITIAEMLENEQGPTVAILLAWADAWRAWAAPKEMKCCCRTRPTFPRRKGDRCKLFFCRGCKLYQPWCRGAADATPEVCDQCAPTKRTA